MALTAETYCDTIHRHIGDASNTIIKTFYATEAVEYKKGDFVLVDTDGRVTKATGNNTAIDGIVASDVDNSEGGNDDVMVPVVVKGNVWVDVLIADSTYLNFGIGDALEVYGDTGTTTENGQSVAKHASMSNEQFVALSIQAATLAAEKRKGLVYFKGIDKWA